MSVIDITNIDLTTGIGSVLRDAGGTVDINFAPSFFQEAAKINMWSKYKPVKHTSLFSPISEIYTGYNGQCGFNFPVSNNLNDLVALFIANNANWSYDRPDGSMYPLRLSDFVQYYTDAVKPLYPLGDIYGNIGTGNIQKRYFSDPASGVTLNLHLNQLSYNGVSFADMYWAIVFIDKNNNPHAGCMSVAKMGSTNEVPIPLFSPYFTEVANYKGICLLTNVSRYFTSFKNGGSWGTDAFYIGLPIPAFNMSVVDRNLLGITCHAEYAQNDSGINFDIYGTNLTDADISTGQITI